MDERELKPLQNQEKDFEESGRFKTYTLKELETILSVTNRTLQQYIKDGKIKAVKIGGKWRVTPENLEKFINGVKS